MSKNRGSGGRILDALGAGLAAAGRALRSNPSTLADPEPWLRELFAGPTASGVSVTESSAMRLAAHFSCVSLTSRVIGSFPVHIHERLPGGRNRIATDHPVYRLLHDQPNPEMTAFGLKETMQANLSNAGKAFAEIVWGRDGYPKELWPIPPQLVTPRRKPDGKLEYLVNGESLPSWKVLHIPGLGFDGVNSFSPVGLFRQAIGLGLAAEEYGARFFGQGTNIGGFIEYPKNLSEDAYKRLKGSMEEKYRGLQKSHGTIILEEGGKYTKIGMSMEDAQFIETQKLNRSTIAMIHGIPPHLIGDLEKATFSNIEHQGIEAVVYLFRPWAVRWEQALTARLFTRKEQERFYIRFNLDGLLRGDTKARYDAYAVGRQWGWLNVDDIRCLEDMDPLPDEKGQVYLQPLNMVPATKDARAQLTQIVQAVLEEARTEPARIDVIEPDEPATVPQRETEPLDFSQKRSDILSDPDGTVRAIYEELALSVQNGIGPLSGDAAAFLEDYCDALRKRLSAADPLAELHRLRNASLRHLYERAGVKRLALKPGSVLRAVAPALAEDIAQRKVDIESPFFEKDQELTSGGLSIRIGYRVWNPPVFPGDDSEIIPVLED